MMFLLVDRVYLSFRLEKTKTGGIRDINSTEHDNGVDKDEWKTVKDDAQVSTLYNKVHGTGHLRLGTFEQG